MIKIEVTLEGTIDHPQPQNPNASGRIFFGTMKCRMRRCNGSEINAIFQVECGGYNDSPRLKKKNPNPAGPETGSDTSIPAIDYTVMRTQNNGPLIPEGHLIESAPRRRGLLVHGPERPRGSSGCIVITGDGEFARWKQLIGLRRQCAGQPREPDPVPMTLVYTNQLTPNFIWLW
jgi:hypothetical protein